MSGVAPGRWWMWSQSYGHIYVGPVDVVKVTKAQIRLAADTPASGYRHVLGIDAAEHMYESELGAKVAAAAWLRMRASALRSDAAEAERAANELEAARGPTRSRGWEVLP